MWLASLNDDGRTADALGEEMLRGAILSKFPNIEQIEHDYQNGRAKLNDEAKGKLQLESGSDTMS